jgi:hypothetical protein
MTTDTRTAAVSDSAAEWRAPIAAGAIGGMAASLC